jgi:hypothetical protein
VRLDRDSIDPVDIVEMGQIVITVSSTDRPAQAGGPWENGEIMARFRSTMRQSPAIIISIVALTFSLGGGAGYAASVATAKAPATKITWHALKLLNGWHAAGKAFHTGNPAYTVSNGIVYLTGTADHAGTSLPTLGALPKGARPTHTLWFGAFNEAAAGGAFVEIAPNGAVIVGGSGGDQDFFTSLAGIEFPLGS